MKKMIFAPGLLLGLLLSLGLSGCRAGGQPEGEKGEPVVLTLMAPSWGYSRFREVIEEQFPEVALEVQYFPEEQYYTVLKTKLATGNGADFIDVQFGYAGSNGVESLAEAGYLLPLDQEKLRWYALAREESRLLTAGDEVYGISNRSMMLGVIYNKKIFQQCGLDLPQCWEDFLECCRVIQENGIQPIVGSGGNTTSLQFGPYQIAVNQLYADKPLFDEQLRDGTAAFTDAGTWDAVLERYFSLYDKGYIREESIHFAYAEAMDMLMSRKAAMMFASSLYVDDLMREGGTTAFLGFLPLPANDCKKPLYVCKSNLGEICGYAGSSHAELCREILQAYYNEDSYGVYDDRFDEILPACYQDLPSYRFCNQGWPNEVEIVLENKIREYVSKKNCKVEDITEAMQREMEK